MVVETSVSHNDTIREVVYFQFVSDDLSDAAKRLNIPLWGRLLLWGLVPLVVLAAGAFVTGFVKLNKIEQSVRILASKQSPDTKELIKDTLAAQINQGVLDQKIADKVAPVSKQLDSIGATVDAIRQGQAQLTQRLDQQQALARIDNPERIFAIIQVEIRIAQTSSRPIPSTQLVDYKNALRTLSSSSSEYWRTVATIINYQSFLNQRNGNAPNPQSVAKPCLGLTNQDDLTSKHNSYDGILISNCVVDLDTQTFTRVSFRDAVVRYRGAPTTLRDVTFVNCRFVLDLPPGLRAPAQPRLLLALLNSPDQRSITIQSD
jgi:hypothetical protein